MKSLRVRKRSLVMFITFVFLILIIFGIFMMINGKDAMQIELKTSMGNIVVELYEDMPITAGNFKALVEKGFYDGITFHRIIEGFVIQGGDPKGNGMGGPGYTIEDEFAHAGGNRNEKYTLSMANAGPNTGGSQFFINLQDNSYLDSKHPVFGKVVKGMDVVDRMAKVETDGNDKPLTPVKILKATIL